MATKKDCLVKRIASLVDRAHELIDDGLTGHRTIEQLLREDADIFEATHAYAQAQKERNR